MNRKKTAFFLCFLLVVTGLLCPLRARALGDVPLLTTLVRSSPSGEAWVLGQLREGTAVEVLGQQNDYYRVDCFGTDGYISREQLRLENGTFRVRCTPDSPESRSGYNLELPEALAVRNSLIALAQAQLGTPYVYGGETPGGFDCSGLTYYLYGSHGIPLHRTASQQLQDGIIVPKEGLQPGDLVFFREPYEVTPASHVGIYAGDGQIIHAGRKGISYANLDSSYFRDYYLCARRLVNVPAMELSLRPVGEIAPMADRISGGLRSYTAVLPCSGQEKLPRQIEKS